MISKMSLKCLFTFSSWSKITRPYYHLSERKAKKRRERKRHKKKSKKKQEKKMIAYLFADGDQDVHHLLRCVHEGERVGAVRALAEAGEEGTSGLRVEKEVTLLAGDIAIEPGR